MEEFVRLVAAMRRAQRSVKKGKAKTVIECRRLEREVDLRIRMIRYTQLELF